MTFDGTMQEYDIELVKHASNAVSISVITCGGAIDIMILRWFLKNAGLMQQ